ncbi:MAG: 50S ribosomal protein L11 methyltransferase [Alphaproteobacteria bacterium]|jgi:ribosomal protein L11 methyltransferase
MLSENSWKVVVIVPEASVENFAMALEAFCYGISAFEIVEGGDWRVEGFCAAMPAHETLVAAIALAAMRSNITEPDFACTPVPAMDWVAETQKNFQPFQAGRYFIQPSHFEGAAPSGAFALTVDAGAAFGTGEHATTKGCLLAFDWLAKRRGFSHVLDLGCGSGILAMAAARTWRKKVLASDIDPVSVAVAQENFRINKLTPLARAYVSRGFDEPALRAGGPYDLIVANILARPLVQLARDIRRNIAPGGIVILSGLLDHQENLVASAYRSARLKLVRRIAIDDWRTLIFSR